MNPLQNLADINPPESVSAWPLAWGYWVVIVIAIALLISAIVLLRRYWRHQQKARHCIKAIKALAPNDPYFCHRAKLLITKFMTHYYVCSDQSTDTNTRFLAVYKTKVSLQDKQKHLEDTLDSLQMGVYANKTYAQSDALSAQIILSNGISHCTPPFSLKGNTRQDLALLIKGVNTAPEEAQNV